MVAGIMRKNSFHKQPKGDPHNETLTPPQAHPSLAAVAALGGKIPKIFTFDRLSCRKNVHFVLIPSFFSEIVSIFDLKPRLGVCDTPLRIYRILYAE
jgi:hypothetical protein